MAYIYGHVLPAVKDAKEGASGSRVTTTCFSAVCVVLVMTVKPSLVALGVRVKMPQLFNFFANKAWDLKALLTPVIRRREPAPRAGGLTRERVVALWSR